MIWETIRLALRSVRRNALRSFLTLLGIVIGVAAVIAMLTIGSGTTEKVKADIAQLGSNLLVSIQAAPPVPEVRAAGLTGASGGSWAPRSSTRCPRA